MHDELLRTLPDLPRWIELRSALRSGRCELLWVTRQPELALIVRDAETTMVTVVGKPPFDALQAAVNQSDTVIADPDLAALLPGWTGARLFFHRLESDQRLPVVPPGQVRLLTRDELPRLAVPSELRAELTLGARDSEIAATLVAGQHVSFCYACALTESLWDIAIDTLPAYRNRGYGALAVAYMIRHMRAQGRAPVWQAVQTNPASCRLAQKLGFVVVDERVLFERTGAD